MKVSAGKTIELYSTHQVGGIPVAIAPGSVPTALWCNKRTSITVMRDYDCSGTANKRSPPMSMRVIYLPSVICVLALFSAQSFAQSVPPRPVNATLQGQQQLPPPTGNSIDTVANEIELLRKSLQTLNARLREISDKLPAPDAKPGANDKQKSIALNMDLEWCRILRDFPCRQNDPRNYTKRRWFSLLISCEFVDRSCPSGRKVLNP